MFNIKDLIIDQNFNSLPVIIMGSLLGAGFLISIPLFVLLLYNQDRDSKRIDVLIIIWTVSGCLFFLIGFIGLPISIIVGSANTDKVVNTSVLEQIRIDIKTQFNIDLPAEYTDWLKFDDQLFPQWFKEDIWMHIMRALIKYPIK